MSTEGERAIQHDRQLHEEKLEEARREHERWSQALDAGLQTHIAQRHQMTGAHFTDEDVIESARKYYALLGGS